MNPGIIHEDTSTLLISKPAGMVVNRARSVPEETLQDWIRAHLTFPLSRNTMMRNGIVHRLDKETSGIMVIAKTDEAFTQLTRQFRERLVTKKYLALVHGKMSPQSGTISLPLERSREDRTRFRVWFTGRRATTTWETMRTYSTIRETGVVLRWYQGFSLLSVTPETGRTHQIRVHLSHLAHPIVADLRYAGKRRAKEDRKWCPRLFLHAVGLSFIHPGSGRRMEFRDPLPADLSQVLDLLE